MVRVTGGRIDELTPDNLIAKNYPPADSFVIELKTPGEYKRGTVLSLESDGKYEVLGSGSGTASAVLSDDTLENDDTAVAYRSGHFNRNALIVAAEYELTAADENNLRMSGIFLSDAMENAHSFEGGVLAPEETDDDSQDDDSQDETLGALTVTSAEGTNAGDTKLTVSPAKESGNSYKYKVGDSAETITAGMSVASGWTAWDGSADITAATGKTVTVVECDGESKAVKAGSATVTAKA